MLPLTVLDTFSGIGGMAYGLEMAGMEIVAMCENDEACRAELVRKHPNVPMFFDIEELAHLQISKDVNYLYDCNLDSYGKPKLELIYDNIDVVCGGPPCQGYSTAGQHKGDDDDRSILWREFARIVGEVKPKYCIFENSPNIRNHALVEILKTFNEIGYNGEWEVISNYFIGSSNQRERIFIVFWRKDIPYCDPFRWFRADLEKEKSQSFWWAKRRFKRNSLFKQIAAFEPKVLQFNDGTSKELSLCESAVGQIGNAVNPEIIKLIGKGIIDGNME